MSGGAATTQVQSIRKSPIDPNELVSVIIRYLIILTLMAMSFIYIETTNIQFMIYIILLIVVIFCATFVLRDLSITKALWADNTPFINIYTTNSAFSFLFLFTIGTGIIFKIISLVLVIIVLNYGRDQLKNNNTSLDSTLTADNTITLNTYSDMFIKSSLLLGILIAMLFIAYTKYEIRTAIVNMSSIILTLGALGLLGYEMYYASRFFDIYKTRGMVYQSSIKNINTNAAIPGR